MPTSKFIDLMGHKRDIRKVVTSPSIVSDSLIGVEIELENIPLQDRNELDYWSVVEDGSLKNNGHEFIFNQPMGGSDIISALSELENYIKSNEFEPNISERTSVHVHVDIRDLDKSTYIDFISLYLVFEMSLFHHCGGDRASNCFSMPWRKLDKTITAFSLCNTDGQLARFIHDMSQNKYTSINLGATERFGSIEFRGHGGEWRTKPLLIWINMLLSLKEYVKNNDIVWKDLLPQISHLGSERFTHNVFGKYAGLLEYPNQTYDIIQGVRLVQDILYGKDIRECYNNYGKDEYGDFDLVKKDNVSNRFKKYLNNKRKVNKGDVE